MHESMLYRINENALIKQDSSDVESGLEMDNLDLFDILTSGNFNSNINLEVSCMLEHP